MIHAERVHGTPPGRHISQRIAKGRLREPSIMQDYHQLDIWQRAMTYVVQIYEFSAQLPQDERFNLPAQLRKPATSLPLNIAEASRSTTHHQFPPLLRYPSR